METILLIFCLDNFINIDVIKQLSVVCFYISHYSYLVLQPLLFQYHKQKKINVSVNSQILLNNIEILQKYIQSTIGVSFLDIVHVILFLVTQFRMMVCFGELMFPSVTLTFFLYFIDVQLMFCLQFYVFIQEWIIINGSD